MMTLKKGQKGSCYSNSWGCVYYWKRASLSLTVPLRGRPVLEWPRPFSVWASLERGVDITLCCVEVVAVGGGEVVMGVGCDVVREGGGEVVIVGVCELAVVPEDEGSCLSTTSLGPDS